MYMKKSCPMKKGLPANSSYPGQTFFSYISLQNMANCLHQKQKVEEEEGWAPSPPRKANFPP